MAILPRTTTAGEQACRRCRKQGISKAKCKIEAKDSHFECARCLKTGEGPCNFVENRLRLFATDFHVRNFDLEPDTMDSVCKSCEGHCGHSACPDSEKRRRLCISPDRIYGWCGKPASHRVGWDIENQPYKQAEDHMRYFYQERPEEYAAPWSSLYVRKALDHHLSSPYLCTSSFTPDSRRHCLDDPLQNEVKTQWVNERRRMKPATFVAKGGQVRDILTNVTFLPNEEVLTCRRVCTLCAFLDLSHPRFQRVPVHMVPGLYTVKWKVQLFNTSILKTDLKFMNRRTLKPLVDNLRAAVKDVDSAIAAVSLERHDTVSELLVYSSAGADELQRARDCQAAAINNLDSIEDYDDSRYANPLNFPLWENHAYHDRPGRPVLCFSIGYPKSSSGSMHQAQTRFHFGRGNEFLIDQALEQGTRVDRWLEQDEYFAIRDQGWVYLNAENFEVKMEASAQPVLMVCNVDSGAWCGGFRFGGVDIIKQ